MTLSVHLGKPRPREGKGAIQDHQARKWRSLDLHLGTLAPEGMNCLMAGWALSELGYKPEEAPSLLYCLVPLDPHFFQANE